jgi:hypothetical protein
MLGGLARTTVNSSERKRAASAVRVSVQLLGVGCGGLDPRSVPVTVPVTAGAGGADSAGTSGLASFFVVKSTNSVLMCDEALMLLCLETLSE